MNVTRPKVLIAIGAVLIVCAVAFFTLVCNVAWRLPRLYASSATLEARSTNPTGEMGATTYKRILEALQHTATPREMSGRGLPKVELHEVRNTSLFLLTVYDPDREEAAERANLLAASVQEQLRASPTVARIVTRAEVSRSPSEPNFLLIMAIAGCITLLLGSAGLAAIIIGLKQKHAYKSITPERLN